MNIEVRTIVMGKKSWANEIVSSLERKISFFQKIEFKQYKEKATLLKNIDNKDFVIVCDERGESPKSRVFAEKFQKVLDSGKQKVVFIVGGPFGVDPIVKERANMTLSLSHFVFNQELACVVLFEQIFRALSIIENHPYHND